MLIDFQIETFLCVASLAKTFLAEVIFKETDGRCLKI